MDMVAAIIMRPMLGGKESLEQLWRNLAKM
jgi:hypothetical protein